MEENLNLNIDPRIKFKLLPPATIIKNFVDGEPDCNYENYLLDLLNRSSHLKEKGHSLFSKLLNENNGQCDIISKNYEIEFKLLSSSTRLQASHLFSPGISNYGGSIIGIHESKKKFGEVKVNQIHVAFRTRDILTLTQLRDNFLNIRKYCIERDIIIVLKMLEKQKNLLLFFPYSFELIDILETDNLDDIIVSTLNYDFHSLFEYRGLKAKEFETYFVTIFQERFYIFSVLDDTLCLIEKVDCMSLPTFIKLKNYHL